MRCYVFPSDESLLMWLYNNGLVIMVFSKQINSSITYGAWFLDGRASTCLMLVLMSWVVSRKEVACLIRLRILNGLFEILKSGMLPKILDLLMITFLIMFCILRAKLISVIGIANSFLKRVKAMVRSTSPKPLFDSGWTSKICTSSKTFRWLKHLSWCIF